MYLPFYIIIINILYVIRSNLQLHPKLSVDELFKLFTANPINSPSLLSIFVPTVCDKLNDQYTSLLDVLVGFTLDILSNIVKVELSPDENISLLLIFIIQVLNCNVFGWESLDTCDIILNF